MEPSKEEIPSTRFHWLKALLHYLTSHFTELSQTAKKLAKDDPRRIVHGVKVGLAITLISLMYYSEDLFEGFGVAAMWAVLTVVVVFEFSVGATLGKGVNRVLATVFASLLGVGAHSLASLTGDQAEPLILGLFVFILAAVVTFLRFFPKLKARYDYGLMIIILTFSLVCVSGYRDDEVLAEAQRRMSTILIGSFAAVEICILICPVWAGNDLHNLVADNVGSLAYFLQEFGGEYFKEPGEKISDEKKEFMDGFMSILNSKSIEDSLVNYAKWEPRHGRFRYRHPWEEYQNIGTLTRQFAYILEALNRYFHAQHQAPKEVKAKVEEQCRKMSSESGKALTHLSKAIKSMTHPPPITVAHVSNAQLAAKHINSLLQTTSHWTHHRLSDVVPAATVASLLLDAVSSTAGIVEAVQKLAILAHFREAPASDLEVIIKVDEGAHPGFSEARKPLSLEMVHQIGE